MADYKKGARIGPWELIQNVGKGGNGEVWEVSGQGGERAAMKVLCKPKESARKRFEGEISIHRNHADVSGILPLLDSSLPSVGTRSAPAYFVMPLARPLTRNLPRDVRGKVDAIVSIAVTLAQLHSRGVAHRDLKPANLLFWKDRPCVGDFGIAEYPDQPDLTDRSGLGPKWTIAPEMRRSPDTAKGPPADVYSLAKTLWILLTGVDKAFDGQYVSRVPNSLRTYCAGTPLLQLLERTLERATANDPAERQTMSEFAEELRTWRQRSGDFQQQSLTDWRMLQEHLFPHVIPIRAEWQDLSSIVAILTLLGRHAELNHAFAPNGGGLDLTGAALSTIEDGCIELKFELDTVVIVRPVRLLFESFQDQDNWAYFRLETAELTPSGVYEDWHGSYEELLELSPGDYRPRSLYDQGCLHDSETGWAIPLPDSARLITRQFRGPYVIFAKASIYNQIDSYEGNHAKVSADDYRRQVEGLIEQWGRPTRAIR